MSYEQAMKDQVCIGDKNPMVWQDDAIALAKQADEEIAELVQRLHITNEELVIAYGQVSNPDNREGWSDDDVYLTYRDNKELLAKAKGGA